MLASKVPTVSKDAKVPKKRWKMTLPFERNSVDVDCGLCLCQRERERERERVSQCECVRVPVCAQVSECYECVRENVSLLRQLRK